MFRIARGAFKVFNTLAVLSQCPLSRPAWTSLTQVRLPTLVATHHPIETYTRHRASFFISQHRLSNSISLTRSLVTPSSSFDPRDIPGQGKNKQPVAQFIVAEPQSHRLRPVSQIQVQDHQGQTPCKPRLTLESAMMQNQGSPGQIETRHKGHARLFGFLFDSGLD